MKSVAQCFWVIATSLVAMALAWTPAAAQQVKTVAGVVVNIGLVPAEVALRADGHREAKVRRAFAGYSGWPSDGQHWDVSDNAC